MRHLLIWILAGALITSVCVVSTYAQVDKDAQHIAKVKKDVNKIGVDERVNVRLLDGTTIKGRISEIGDDYFVLIEKRNADSRTLTFAQVKQVRLVSDNPFEDPAVWVGIAIIPVVILASAMARGH